MEDNKILLHACCAICAAYPIKFLIEQGYAPTVFFTNDNIDTNGEFERRKQALLYLCEHFNIPYIIDTYKHNNYLNYVKGLENEPERGARCKNCIEYRLKQTAQKAKDLGFTKFTTTLVISPHKNFDLISKLGDDIAEEYSLEYKSINFRKQDGFLKTNEIANSLNLYRQNYCGCEFAKSHLK